MTKLKTNKTENFIVMGVFALILCGSIGFMGYVAKNNPQVIKGIVSVSLGSNVN